MSLAAFRGGARPELGLTGLADDRARSALRNHHAAPGDAIGAPVVRRVRARRALRRRDRPGPDDALPHRQPVLHRSAPVRSGRPGWAFGAGRSLTDGLHRHGDHPRRGAAATRRPAARGVDRPGWRGQHAVLGGAALRRRCGGPRLTQRNGDAFPPSALRPIVGGPLGRKAFHGVAVQVRAIDGGTVALASQQLVLPRSVGGDRAALAAAAKEAGDDALGSGVAARRRSTRRRLGERQRRNPEQQSHGHSRIFARVHGSSEDPAHL